MQDSLIQNRLKDFFKNQKESDAKIFNQLALYIYAIEAKNSDLHILAKLLDEQSLTKLVNYYDGDSIKLPSKDEYWDAIITAFSYYCKCIKGMSWSEIKEALHLPEKDKEMISSIKFGYAVNKISREITRELKEILKQVEGKTLNEILTNIKNGLNKNNE